jgi:hypothetical protein
MFEHVLYLEPSCAEGNQVRGVLTGDKSQQDVMNVTGNMSAQGRIVSEFCASTAAMGSKSLAHVVFDAKLPTTTVTITTTRSQTKKDSVVHFFIAFPIHTSTLH